MFHRLIVLFLFFVLITLSSQSTPFAVGNVYSSNEHLLAKHEMSLETRYPNESVNVVFKDNILLTLAYLAGTVNKSDQVNWSTVESFHSTEVTLQPGEVFAFQDDVLPVYEGKVIKTTQAHFNAQEGFKSDGYLVGDGVCHLASLINWAAQDAGLKVTAPTNHNFAVIPEVPKAYGTAIYYSPNSHTTNQLENLYVENTFAQPVRIVFRYENNELSVTVYKDN